MNRSERVVNCKMSVFFRKVFL